MSISRRAVRERKALDLVIYNPVSVVASTDQVAVPPQLILNGKLEFRGTGLAAG